MVDKDPWATESGNLTNYEGTVVDAWFGTDPGYNADTRMLFLKMATDAPERPEHEERYNLPTGWETWDAGKSVEYKGADGEAKPDKLFNKASQVGQLIEHVALMSDALEVLRGRGNPRTAGVWVGMRFFWEEESKPYKFKDRETGEMRTGTTNKNFPTKYLGTVDTLMSPAVQSASADTPSNGSTPQTPLDRLSDTDRIVFGAWAKSMEHPAWVDKVMDHDGGRVCADQELVAALADDAGLYAQLKGG